MTYRLLAALVSLTLIACGNPVAPAAEDLSDSDSSQAELKASRASKTPAKKSKGPAAATEPAAYAVQASDSATAPVFKTTFDIATTYDVFVAFDIPVTLAGQHVAVFEISSPSGIYQRTEVPFSTGTATKYRVWSSMPVAGTWIEQYAMTGAWTVKVFMDAETAPRATQTITLQ
jgi:hypothetical protein